MERETGNQQYSVLITNKSKYAWKFVLYQKPPTNVETLAWFTSPYKIGTESNISFTWDINYQFVWDNTGVLKPGINFTASGSQPCDPDGNNLTHFTMTNNTPSLSPSTTGAQKGTLKIVDGPNVPPNTFSVGLAMSGKGIYAVNAGPNLSQIFTPTPSYWVCAMNEVHEGDVMDIKTITQTKELKFPTNTYNLKATLHADNSWEVGV